MTHQPRAKCCINERHRFSRSVMQRKQPAQGAGQDEAGAIIILALVFLVAVSLIVVGLLTWVGTSLTATSSFANERSTESAATSAVNLAIQNSRYTFATQILNASPPQACWYDPGGNAQQPPAFNNQQMDVWCSMTWQPFSASTRTITYSACPSTLTNTQCAATPTLQASLTFDDYAPGIGVPTANPVQCNLTGFCGQSMTQNSWLWSPTVPSVSSISPTTATVNGTNASTGQPQTLTINGSGFVQGASSVNFVQETGASGTPANAPSTTNSPAGVIVTLPASQVTWGGCTGANCTVSVSAPAVTSGTDYFVTVTTPAGTSPYLAPAPQNAYLDLQVTNVVPIVTGITGPDETGTPPIPGGSITGGSTVTISGSGFWSASNFATQVWFWPVGGGSRVQGTNVNVLSNGSLTAITPAVTAIGNYYAQVDTLGGNSTSTSAIFNYGVQVPIIIGLSPSSAGAGTTLTINGYNFLSGSTVGFCLDTGGNYVANCVSPGGTTNGQIAATVTSLTASQIKVTVPTGLQVGKSYYPVVTLPSQFSQNTYPPSQPYNEPADVFTRSS
jgi:hypothetical protein